MSETILLSEYLNRKSFSGYGTLAEEAERIWDLAQTMEELGGDEEREDEYDEACEECDEACRKIRRRFLFDGVRTLDPFGYCVCESAKSGLAAIDIDDYANPDLTMEFLDEIGVGELTVSVEGRELHALITKLYRSGWVMESPCEIEKDCETRPAYRFVRRGR